MKEKQRVLAESTAELASQLGASRIMELTVEEMELVVGGDDYTGTGL